MGIYKNFLVTISNNKPIQKLLRSQARAINHAMGIGAGGEFEQSGEFVALDLLQKLPGPYCIFDVGANRGQFLQYTLQKMAKHDCLVHSFEPGRDAFRILSQGAAHDAKVKLNNFALGQTPGEATLFYNSDAAEGASLYQRDLRHLGVQFDHSETIQINSLDNYCTDQKIAHIHLLKIDVEGHELDVLKGATRMLSQQAIDIIIFEFGGCNIDNRRFFRDYWHFFQPTNMKLARVTPSGYLISIDNYHEEFEQFQCSNFIAIRKNSH